MDEQNLRNWLNVTMLVPMSMKQQLGSISWTEDIFQYILDLYNNYAYKEQQLATDLYGKSTTIIIDYIKEVEREDKTIEQETLIKLYQYIRTLRNDI